MPKKIVNDIIVPNKSIRQIPLSPEKKKESRRLPKAKGYRKSSNPKFAIWLIAIVALLALFFGVSVLFSSVTLTVKPRLATINFKNETYTAKLDSPALTDLSYEIIKLDQTVSEKVDATEEKVASQKASGKIVIYNNYSSAVQRFISNTRFEAVNGKIYRIASSVDVPGTKTVNGKTVPGSIEATVYADQPGDSYNLKLTDLAGDFKVPGLKGTPRYDTFYARLKTDITGGLIGRQKTVAQNIHDQAVNKMKQDLTSSLVKELYAVKPDNYLVFPNSYSIVFSEEQNGLSSDSNNQVTLNLKGTISAIVFNGLKFANYIANHKISDYDSLPVSFVFNDSLSVQLKGKETQLTQNKTLDLILNGSAAIKWNFDENKVRGNLLGQPSSMALTILSSFKNQAESIDVVFTPIWARYFPERPEKIKFIELDE